MNFSEFCGGQAPRDKPSNATPTVREEASLERAFSHFRAASSVLISPVISRRFETGCSTSRHTNVHLANLIHERMSFINAARERGAKALLGAFAHVDKFDCCLKALTVVDVTEGFVRARLPVTREVPRQLDRPIPFRCIGDHILLILFLVLLLLFLLLLLLP